MKKKTLFLLPLFGMFVLASCTQDISQEMTPHPVSQKIVNTPENACANTILVQTKEHMKTEDLASLLATDDILSIGMVFPEVESEDRSAESFGLDRWYEITVRKGADVAQVAETISNVDATEKVQFNTLAVKASDGISYAYSGTPALTKAGAGMVFDDPLLGDQWHYINTGDKSFASTAYKGADINIKDVWELIAGDPSIIVAVIDEGVKYTHPDLKDNMWTNTAELNGTSGVDDDGNGYVDDIHGYNFTSNGPITWNKNGDSGHGTHIAGTIAAVNNNGLGVSGIAGGSGKGDGVKIMSCQTQDGNTAGTAANSAKAIKYAADMGASVIQCSWGYPPGAITSDGSYERQFSIQLDAIRYFESKKNNPVLDGGIAVFASGNEGLNYASYPGAYRDVICVSAFGPDYLPTWYTNYGPGCNIIAPGGEAYLEPWTPKSCVLSTLCSETSDDKVEYGYMQGTSMACPHVSGIVALGIAYAKKLGKTYTVKEFRDMLVTSANEFDSRLKGSKTYASGSGQAALDLSKFLKQMGTGSIDAWRFLMKIEGVPCLEAETGRNQWIDVSDYFGTSSVNLTYIGVEVSEKGRNSLGLAADPYMKNGRLYIHPTKPGSAKITVKAIAGGTQLGSDEGIGGMEVTQEISIIARSFKSKNGGWL